MSQPLRTCLGCRSVAARPQLVRLAWDAQENRVVVDSAQRLGGRGCYLHPGCAAQVLRRRAVGRALRRAVDHEQVAALLAGLS